MQHFGFPGLTSFAVVLAALLHPMTSYSDAQVELQEHCTGHRPPSERVIDALRAERERIAQVITAVKSVILARLPPERRSLIARVSVGPKPPLRHGYGVLPEIVADSPELNGAPRETRFALEPLAAALEADRRAADLLAREATEAALEDMEALVEEYERLNTTRLDWIDRQLVYHEYWQKAVVEHAAFFAARNRLLEPVRKLAAQARAGTPATQTRAPQDELREELGPFRRTPGLSIEVRADGLQSLPVTVRTDIQSASFLRQFEAAMEDVFNDSPAARQQEFRVVLAWSLITPSALYDGAPPTPGAEIDLDSHLARFPPDTLVLTTGAQSTHAWTGRRIVLGPEPISRRELAHEFGHLLGFDDAYLRAYTGDPCDPHGAVVVEWSGLFDDLMGRPASGVVTKWMISNLLQAYRPQKLSDSNDR